MVDSQELLFVQKLICRSCHYMIIPNNFKICDVAMTIAIIVRYMHDHLS